MTREIDKIENNPIYELSDFSDEEDLNNEPESADEEDLGSFVGFESDEDLQTRNISVNEAMNYESEGEYDLINRELLLYV
jgi:hypothetical protein